VKSPLIKPPLDTRLIDPSRELLPDPKTVERTHDEVVSYIAEELYQFPTPEYPHFRTTINVPEAQQRIFTNYGRELIPDIVVLEWPERIVRIIGEVAVPQDLTMDTALDQWLPESRLVDVAFYLYLPAGFLKQAKVLLKDAGIKKKDVGLRTWRRLARMGAPDIAMFA